MMKQNRLWQLPGKRSRRFSLACLKPRVPNEERAMSGQGRDSTMERKPQKAGAVEASPHDDAVRQRAIEERRTAARREKLRVRPDSPPFLRVEAPSGFAYRIQLRGSADGPHSCNCPDFEANRLHTCKHVERVRTWLESTRSQRSVEHQRDVRRSRVYLHFGEV